jgi:predicted Zn-dependent protease
MTYVPPPEIPEDINVSKGNPLAQMGKLLLNLVIIMLLAYIILGFASDWLVGHLSPERELAIGQSFIAPLLENQELKGDPRAAYLNELMTSVLADGDIEPERQAIAKIFVVDGSTPNAAAFPGGQLIVTEGLLDQVKSENELYFVLGHEVGHFAVRDSLRGMGRSLVFTVIVSAAPQVVQTAGQLTDLTYRRGQESAADQYALKAVIDRYGHGGHSLDFFAHMQKLEQVLPNQVKKVSGYFSTHPLTDDRIDRLNSLAAKNGWSMQGKPTPTAIDLSASAPSKQLFPI